MCVLYVDVICSEGRLRLYEYELLLEAARWGQNVKTRARERTECPHLISISLINGGNVINDAVLRPFSSSASASRERMRLYNAMQLRSNCGASKFGN